MTRKQHSYEREKADIIMDIFVTDIANNIVIDK